MSHVNAARSWLQVPQGTAFEVWRVLSRDTKSQVLFFPVINFNFSHYPEKSILQHGIPRYLRF